jgi:DNA mismatch repair protein MutH
MPKSPMPPSPATLDELLARAQRLGGMSVAELAHAQGYRVPRDLRGHKGWVGQLVERGLGARAGAEPEPDFPALGVELKTIPLSEEGRPLESTYVCMTRLDGSESSTWEGSFVQNKLQRVLFVPVIQRGARGEDLALRRFGMPFLWLPDAADDKRLAADFTRLAARVRQGEVERVRGHEGEVLQIRAKAMGRHERTLGVSEEGWLVEVQPRGWYLRATFTAELVVRAFGGGWPRSERPGRSE